MPTPSPTVTTSYRGSGPRFTKPRSPCTTVTRARAWRSGPATSPSTARPVEPGRCSGAGASQTGAAGPIGAASRSAVVGFCLSSTKMTGCRCCRCCGRHAAARAATLSSPRRSPRRGSARPPGTAVGGMAPTPTSTGTFRRTRQGWRPRSPPRPPGPTSVQPACPRCPVLLGTAPRGVASLERACRFGLLAPNEGPGRSD